MTTYGYFDDANREYVITNPMTPVKWINYVGTLAFGGLVDHTGGLLICKDDPGLNRLTKYIPQLPSSDFKGSTLYLRLKQGAGWKLFSPFFVPTLDPYDRFECHVGMGYSRFVTEFYGIRSEITIFVPLGDTRVIQDIRLTNIGPQAVELDAIPVVEYTHFDALKQFNNADWVPQTMQSDRVMDGDYTVLMQYAFMHKGSRERFFTSNVPASSFETDRKQFLGRNEYGSWAMPLSLQQPELPNSEARRGDNIAALLHHLGTLQPGESRRLVTQLGLAAGIQDALPGIRRYRDGAQVDQALAELHAYWVDYLGTIQVDTPVASMNSMLNIHHPRQCYTTFNWSRYLSLYQLGLGQRGMGFRDSSQDVMGVVGHIPGEAKALLVKLLSVQMRAGLAMHQFYPLTMEGSMGDASEMVDRPHYYSDDHLWVILAVCAYLKETGDFTFLGEAVPYYDKDEYGDARESGTVWDHMQRAVEYTRTHTGAHGLPLAGYADWNDTINLSEGAESLFTANLYGVALRELMVLAEFHGLTEDVVQFSAYYEAMKALVNEHAWDGDWYVRYFDAAGQPLGSRNNTVGQIFTNGQSWPVLSGFATPERAQMALDAVRERLNTANGIKLSVPGCNGYDPRLGGVSTYPPGAKENGGIFLHANPWVMIAETMLGRADRAFEYYNQINPAAKNDIIDQYECEPYAYAQNILGDEHPLFGLGRNSWLSGTSSWVYQAATQYILGVRATYHGLLIDPCIPADWDGFRMTRRFRGATYEIHITNPRHVTKGVASMTVDGARLDGSVVPVLVDGVAHRVEVVMG